MTPSFLRRSISLSLAPKRPKPFATYCCRVAERIPDSYSDCYMILGESGVIDWPLAERLSALAKFRDLLIHQYGEINNERVYAIILKDLQDLDLFLTRVSLFIGAKRT